MILLFHLADGQLDVDARSPLISASHSLVDDHAVLLLLVCVSFTIIGQP